MFFQYTQDCIVGVEQIDEEHQYLFSLMNQLMDSVSSGDGAKQLEPYIRKLVEYGEVHFAHEEAYLEKMGDIELPRQKRDHMLFMNRMKSLDLLDLDDKEKHKLLEDTLIYMTKWLYNHILGSDTLIGKVEHIAEYVVDEEEFCKFTQKYMTGVELIDNEHRRLFEIIGEAYRIVEKDTVSDRYDEIMHLLDRLEEYAEVHFSHEEQLMEQIQYPWINEQRRAHTIFLEKMEDKDFGENEENQQEYLEELLDFLYAWLGNHIMKMDKPIGDYVR